MSTLSWVCHFLSSNLLYDNNVEMIKGKMKKKEKPQDFPSCFLFPFIFLLFTDIETEKMMILFVENEGLICFPFTLNGK